MPAAPTKCTSEREKEPLERPVISTVFDFGVTRF